MLLDRLQRPIRGVRLVQKAASSDGAQTMSTQIIPYRRLDDADVQRLLDQLSNTPGPLITSAISHSEQDAFRRAGFVEREALHLLRHPFTALPSRSTGSHPMRSGRRRDLRTVLDIDHKSFDDFWALDRTAFFAARKATPVHRYRVSTHNGKVVGYAITGRAGYSSFLQRLGVDPEMRGYGIGTALVADSLHWAQSNGASSMLVNTQVSNEPARRLYESVGFTLQSDQLTVLQLDRS